jgi:predicted nucleic acid-binding protein
VVETERPNEITASDLVVVTDTDVVSFVFKRDTRAELYRRHLEGRRPVISAQTFAELHHWPEFRHWGERRRQELDKFLQAYPVIHSNDEICRLWGEITAWAALAGTPMPGVDAWHVATALYLEAPLVTHNPSHYRMVTGLVVVTEAK